MSLRHLVRLLKNLFVSNLLESLRALCGDFARCAVIRRMRSIWRMSLIKNELVGTQIHNAGIVRGGGRSQERTRLYAKFPQTGRERDFYETQAGRQVRYGRKSAKKNGGMAPRLTGFGFVPSGNLLAT